MARNKTIERDLVLNPCLKYLKCLEDGVILQYRRLDALDKQHIPGSPDIEIWYERDGVLHVLLTETKKPVGGTTQNVQKEYRDKYSKLKNVVYVIITSVQQLEILIGSLPTYSKIVKDMQNFKN